MTISCQFCGAAAHRGVCPRVKRIEFAADGVGWTAVELHAPQAFALEYSDGDVDQMVSGSYDDVMRYRRESLMAGGDLTEDQWKKRFGSKRQ